MGERFVLTLMAVFQSASWGVIIVMCGCDAATTTSLPGTDLKQQIEDASQVRCEFAGAYDHSVYTVTSPNVVNQVVDEITKVRRWRRFRGPISEGREIHIEFQDGRGHVVGKATILGRSLIVRDSNEVYWEADWPEGIGWVIGITQAKIEP